MDNTSSNGATTVSVPRADRKSNEDGESCNNRGVLHNNGNVFQTGQIWSYCSGDHGLPLYYGKIHKITFTHVHEQKPVLKLHMSRFMATSVPVGVIQWEEKKMPVGCGTFYARKALEIVTSDDVLQQIMPQTSMDGNEYTILPKIGDVWVIYRFWSQYQEYERVGFGSYDLVEVLDDTLDYKVLLLERASFCQEDDYEEHILFKEVKEYKSNEIDGSEPIFTIPNSERLRFSHKAPASRVTKETYRGELKELVEVDAEALHYNLRYPDI